MNSMIKFAQYNRTTTYFKNRGVLEIRIAYRIMEYLAPDSVFPPPIEQPTKDLLLKEEFSGAYECVIGEIALAHNTDLGCSAGAGDLRIKAIELMRYLLPLYKATITDKKEKRRIELLRELKELDC